MGGVSPPGGGYSNIVIHTYVGSGQFWGFKILNFNILGGGGLRKMNVFGVWRFCGYSWGNHNIRLYLGVSMHFMVFS